LFSVSSPGLQLSLSQRPEKQYVLHGGGTGVIRQSLAGLSHYYSATRMRASGTLRVAGKTVALSGESWFDHQWGDYAEDRRAFNWDWFSCRFDDRSELMGYQFLDPRTRRPLPELANGTFVDAKGHATELRGFKATDSGQALKAAGHTWPLHWQLTSAPALRNRQGDARKSSSSAIVPTFWEGAPQAAAPTRTCFVEILPLDT
jgi:predicted secreted hydrolase